MSEKYTINQNQDCQNIVLFKDGFISCRNNDLSEDNNTAELICRLLNEEEKRKSVPRIDKIHTNKCKTKFNLDCNCDSYHTFDELYEHRMRLYIELCKSLNGNFGVNVWCSKSHSDGSPMYKDMFILGIGYKKGKQITYHLDMKYFDEVSSKILFLEKPPEFDGHNSDDVLRRLYLLDYLECE